MALAVAVVAGVAGVGFYTWNLRRKQETERQRRLEQRLMEIARAG